MWSILAKAVKRLAVTKTTSIDYEIKVQEKGWSKIQIVGRNRSKIPRVLEVRVDDSPVGMTIFEKEQPKFEKRVLLFRCAPGLRKLTLRTHSTTFPTNHTVTYADRLELDYFDLIPVPNTSYQKMVSQNQSFLKWENIAPISPDYVQGRFTNSQKPTELLNGWGTDPEGVKWQIERPKGESEILTVTIPKDLEVGGIHSPSFEIKPGQYIYGSLEIRTRNLFTHAVNLQVLALSKEGKGLSVVYARTDAVTGNNDWERFFFFMGAPKDSVAYRLTAHIWRAGRVLRLSEGKVSIRNFRIESAPPVEKAEKRQAGK